MDNYVYIVAGLPELTLAFEQSGFKYETVRDYIYPLLSDRDRQAIDLMEESFHDETLNADFYQKTAAHANRFLREYFHFDLLVRNMKVRYLGRRLNQQVDKYLIQTDDSEFEEEKQVQAIFDNPDIVLREQQLDQLRWDKASEITCFDYFDLDIILAFLIKASIIQRWAAMDQEHGSEMFATLVKEVEGTFENIQFEQKK